MSRPEPPPLAIERHASSDGVVRLALSGDLAVSNAAALEIEVQGALREGARSIVVDAGGLGHVDTPAMATLVRASGRVRAAGGELRVVGLGPTFVELARRLELARELGLEPGPHGGPAGSD